MQLLQSCLPIVQNFDYLRFCMIQSSMVSEGTQLACCSVHKAVGIKDCFRCKRQQHGLGAEQGRAGQGRAPSGQAPAARQLYLAASQTCPGRSGAAAAGRGGRT